MRTTSGHYININNINIIYVCLLRNHGDKFQHDPQTQGLR